VHGPEKRVLAVVPRTSTASDASSAALEARARLGYGGGVSSEHGVTYLWDFFGPNAEGTAAHFEVHLRQFLAEHGITDCETGTESEGEGHRAARCSTPAGNDVLERALKPRRRR
jgi:hypothetical protein